MPVRRSLPTIRRSLPTIPTDRFVFKNGVFSAHWQDLREYTFNTYIRLESAQTQVVIDFDLDNVQRDGSGHATEMQFRGIGSHSNLRILINVEGW